MNDWDWKATLAKVAPALATALGGPMAGVAVSMATKALGLEDEGEAALAAAVASGDTNVLAKLRQVENQFKLEMRQLDISIEELNTRDRESARLLAVKKSMLPQTILSTIYTVGYFWLLYELFTGDVKIADGMSAIVNTLMGVMTAAQIQIMNFWFGSSAGSKTKKDLSE
jgi:hypothetical protein